MSADIAGTAGRQRSSLGRVMLASAMAGIAVVLIFSSWKRSAVGLWVSLICAAIPLLWVLGSILAPGE